MSSSQDRVKDLVEMFNRQGVAFKLIKQTQTTDEKTRVVILTQEISKAQLKAITTQINDAIDVDLLNTFRVLGD